METTDSEKMYLLPAKWRNGLLNYLMQQPFHSVFEVIGVLQGLKEIEVRSYFNGNVAEIPKGADKPGVHIEG